MKEFGIFLRYFKCSFKYTCCSAFLLVYKTSSLQVLVSYGCYKRLLQTSWLKARHILMFWCSGIQNESYRTKNQGLALAGFLWGESWFLLSLFSFEIAPASWLMVPLSIFRIHHSNLHSTILLFLFFSFLSFLFFFFFSELTPRHMEVPRLGFE